jgi:intracellular sulfur oxidation DsrE/DsrF family protein
MQQYLRSGIAKAAAADAIFLAVTTGLAQAQAPTRPAVPGFGATHTAPRTAERPSKSLRYKVPFSVTQGNDDTTKPNASLDKVARFMNLLASDGIRPVRGDVVAVMHGKATPIVMDNAAYRASNNAAANPNLELIEQLKKAGVSVRVCSQALAAASIAPEAVDKRGEIDVAALTTIANLQLRRYALSPD